MWLTNRTRSDGTVRDFWSPRSRRPIAAATACRNSTSSHITTHDLTVFLGEREDVETVMSALDVLLVPSRREPFGRVVVEALSMGIRRCRHGRGGPREILTHEDDGVLLAAEDIDSWAEALVVEGDRSDSVDLRRARRERALARFDRAEHVDKVEAVWGAAFRGHRPQRSL